MAAADSFEQRLFANLRLFVTYSVAPAVVALHAFFLWQNSHEVDVFLFSSEATRLSLSFLLCTAVVYALFLSATFFYSRQLDLISRVASLTAQLNSANGDLQKLRDSKNAFVAATSKILVPYSLDQLIDKGLCWDIVDQNAKNSLRIAPHRSV